MLFAVVKESLSVDGSINKFDILFIFDDANRADRKREEIDLDARKNKDYATHFTVRNIDKEKVDVRLR